MNRIDELLKYYQNKINDMTIKQGPTNEEIYQLLCSYNSDLSDLTNQVNEIVSYVDKYVKNHISKSLKTMSDIDINYINSIQGNYLKHLSVMFAKHLPGVVEQIQLYFSIQPNRYQDVVINLYDYLLSSHISFESRISKINRNDNFIIKLYNKQDALKILSYCDKHDISHYLNFLQPFIYQHNKVGIVKDIREINYNKYVANIVEEYIEECILKQRDNPYTAVDLQRFVAVKCKSADNYKDRIMSYNFACFLYSVITNEDIFTRINDKYNIEYVYNSISISSDELCSKVQSCMYQMYLEKYNDQPNKNFKLNNNIINKILKQIEYILLDNKECNIVIGYKNRYVHDLIPYLYGYIGKKYKWCNDKEVEKIINTVKNKMITLISDEDNIYSYQIKNKIINSNIPIIENSKGFCAIEFIDDETKLVNINIVINGKVTNYLNVYVDIDSIILRNNKNYYGRLYRNAIANALLDLNRNNIELEKRKKDFSNCFLSDRSEEVNKYVNVSIIKQIFNQKR